MTTTAAATDPGQAPAARPTIRYYANQLRPLRHHRRGGCQVVPWHDNPNSVPTLKEGYRKARLGVCTAITSTSKEFRCWVYACLGIAWSLTGCLLLRLFSSCWLHFCYQLLSAPPFFVVLVTRLLLVALCSAFSRRVGYTFITSCFLLRLRSSCWLHIYYQLRSAPRFLVVLVTHLLQVAFCSAFSLRVGSTFVTSRFLLRVFSSCWLHVYYLLLSAPRFFHRVGYMFIANCFSCVAGVKMLSCLQRN